MKIYIHFKFSWLLRFSNFMLNQLQSVEFFFHKFIHILFFLFFFLGEIFKSVALEFAYIELRPWPARCHTTKPHSMAPQLSGTPQASHPYPGPTQQLGPPHREQDLPTVTSTGAGNSQTNRRSECRWETGKLKPICCM